MCSRAADVSELRAVGVEQQALDGAVAGRPFEWLVAHVVLQSTSTVEVPCTSMVSERAHARSDAAGVRGR